MDLHETTNKYKYLFILAFFVFWGIVIYIYSDTQDNLLHIGLVGPMTGLEKESGAEMLQAARLYIDKINEQGGINGQKVHLTVLDDQNNKDLARKAAEQLSKDDRVIAVLGHYYSSTSWAASPIYADNEIPAITASATSNRITEENDWYFRMIFSNRLQASFMAQYLVYVLQASGVSLIYDEDEFGRSLAESFEETSEELRLDINNTWSFNTESEGMEQQLNQIVNEIKSKDDANILYLATHAQEAAKIIFGLNAPDVYTFLGPDSLSTPLFLETLQESLMEKLNPGYFSEGIYATSPFIPEISNELAQQFRNEFFARHQKEPSWVAATYYDAIHTLLEAVRATKIQNKPESIAKNRLAIRDYLAALNKPNQALAGITGNIFFNEYGDAIKPVDIGVYRNRKLVTSPIQFQLVEDVGQIEDLQQALDDEKILEITDQYFYKTNIVYTGIDINEISHLDIKDFSYSADFYLWFRYQEEFEDHKVEFTNALTPIVLKDPVVNRTKDGLTVRAYRVKARFKGSFELQEYPFDQQKMTIHFRHADLTRERLIYVPDALGMRIDTKEDFPKKLERIGALASIDGWKLIDAWLFQDTSTGDSTLGVPERFRSNTEIQYSRFNVVVQLTRDASSFIIKNLFSVVILSILTYLVFFIPVDQITIRVSVSITSILTLAFLNLRVSTELPLVGYVVLIEYIFFVMYALMLFGMAISIWSMRRFDAHEIDEAHRINRFGLIVYPIAMSLLTLYIASFYW